MANEDKREKAESKIRELKDWEIRNKQFLEDFQVMEDYLDALAKQLKGNPEEAKEEAGTETK